MNIARYTREHDDHTSVFLCVLCVSLFLLPNILFADLSITEIMYDLDGRDEDREWIEVYAEGESVNLTEWRFIENDVAHRINEYEGGAVLSSGEYAVIAEDAGTFLDDYSAFSGMLFDSSFSLSNTSEELTMRDPEKVTQDTIVYHSEWGAEGTGESLQKQNNSWIAAVPTPGLPSHEKSVVPLAFEEQAKEGVNLHTADVLVSDEEHLTSDNTLAAADAEHVEVGDALNEIPKTAVALTHRNQTISIPWWLFLIPVLILIITVPGLFFLRRNVWVETGEDGGSLSVDEFTIIELED